MATRTLYDGSKVCNECDKCPMAVLDEATGMVTLSDPAKPERGTTTMTAAEWNLLLQHAQPAA